nr:hypothetical protein CFP56_27920 [Quercus suber]
MKVLAMVQTVVLVLLVFLVLALDWMAHHYAQYTLVSRLEFGSIKLYVDCGNYTPVFGSIKVHDGEDLSGLKGSLMEALARIQDIINHHHDQKHTTTEDAIAKESG